MHCQRVAARHSPSLLSAILLCSMFIFDTADELRIESPNTEFEFNIPLQCQRL